MNHKIFFLVTILLSALATNQASHSMMAQRTSASIPSDQKFDVETESLGKQVAELDQELALRVWNAKGIEHLLSGKNQWVISHSTPSIVERCCQALMDDLIPYSDVYMIFSQPSFFVTIDHQANTYYEIRQTDLWEVLTQSHRCSLESGDSKGLTPLMAVAALKSDNSTLVADMIEHEDVRKSINAINQNHKTALHFALASGNYKIALELLMEQELDLSALTTLEADDQNLTLLMKAAAFKDPKYACCLATEALKIDHSTDLLNRTNNKHKSALTFAAINGNTRLYRELQQLRATLAIPRACTHSIIQAKDGDVTPIMFVTSLRHEWIELANYLIQTARKDALSAMTNSRKNVLTFAVQNSHLRILPLLIAQFRRLNIPINDAQQGVNTPTGLAINHGLAPVTRLLIEQGGVAIDEVVPGDLRMPLQIAIDAISPTITKELLDLHAAPHVFANNVTALEYALDKYNQLIRTRQAANATISERELEQGAQILKLLLEKAATSTKTASKKKVLVLKADILKQLYEHNLILLEFNIGVEISLHFKDHLADRELTTLMVAAAIRNHVISTALIRLLLQDPKHAVIDALSVCSKKNALNFAAMTGNDTALKILHEHGETIGNRSAFGDDSLLLALYFYPFHSNDRVIRFILSRHADPNSHNPNLPQAGSALAFAVKHTGNADVVELLLHHNARRGIDDAFIFACHAFENKNLHALVHQYKDNGNTTTDAEKIVNDNTRIITLLAPSASDEAIIQGLSILTEDPRYQDGALILETLSERVRTQAQRRGDTTSTESKDEKKS